MGNYHLGVGILNLQQRGYLSLESPFITDVIGYLDIDFLIALDGNKIYFLFVEYANINLIINGWIKEELFFDFGLATAQLSRAAPSQNDLQKS